MSPKIKLKPAKTLTAGVQQLLDELGCWLGDVIESHMALDWQGTHDEATFVTAWAGYYAYTRDPRVPQLALNLFDKWHDWAETNLVHGYFPRQEVHHGTEHFTIFLDWLRQVAGEREDVANALEDGAHHIGNWCRAVPNWYDYDSKRFLSYELGTSHVGCEGFNFVDHIRLVHLAIAAWRATGRARYRGLALDYMTVWAEAINSSGHIPLYLDPEQHSQAELEKLLRSFLKAAPQSIDRHAKVENHVASGTPKALLDVWLETQDESCLQAAVKIARACVPYLNSPIANPAGHILSRMLTSGTSRNALDLDQDLFPNADTWNDLNDCFMSMRPQPGSCWHKHLGYRFDLPTWQLLGKQDQEIPERPAPGNLMLAWELTGEVRFAIDACTIALGRLRLARTTLRDGRHHGCTAQSIAATVRGHGRCWGIGDVAAVLSNPTIHAHITDTKLNGSSCNLAPVTN